MGELKHTEQAEPREQQRCCNPGPLTMAARPTGAENPEPVGKVMHITVASKLHQWVPTAAGNWAAVEVGLGTLPLQCWDAHDSSLFPLIYNGGIHKLYNHKYDTTPVASLMHLSPPAEPVTSLKQRAHPSDGWQWFWKKQGSNDPGGTRSNNEGKEPYLLQRWWRLEIVSQIQRQWR